MLLFVVGFLWSPLGCVEQLGDRAPYDSADDTKTATSALIYNPESWDHVKGFSSTHDGWLAGEAVAKLTHSGSRCSGFLVSDQVIMTARHCGYYQDTGIQAEFGRFGTYANANDFYGTNDSGIDTARRRLRERLGFSSSAANAAVSSISDLTWSCNYSTSEYTSTWGYRDIHYLTCSPKYWSTGYKTVAVYPGHLFGKLEVRNKQYMSNDDDVWSLSVNGTSGNQNIHRNLLSPNGWVSDYDDGYYYIDGVEYRNGFETLGNDMESGSSGGAILDDTGQVLGVWSGHPSHTMWALYSSSSQWNYNRNAYVSSKAQQELVFNDPTTTTSHLPVVLSGSTSWVGGTGGTNHVYSCPSEHIAVGVIGSTGYGGNVGNLGLVCAPWYPDWPHQLDHSSVYAPGSWDTNFQVAQGWGFHPYYADVTSSVDGLQTVALCPEGEYLSGMTPRTSGNLVSGIYSLDCKAYNQDYTSNSVQPYRQIGTNGGTYHWNTDCNSSGYVYGISINSGWVVDGFQLLCKS